MKRCFRIKTDLNYHSLVYIIINHQKKDEHEDDDNEGDKILTIDDFRKRAMEKLDVLIIL